MKSKKLIALILLAAMVFTFAACNSDSTGSKVTSGKTEVSTVGVTEDTEAESDTASVTTPSDDDPPEEPVVVPPFDDKLISCWDFEGDTLDEQLSDKAVYGTSSDKIKFTGSGCSVSDNILTVSDNADSYASIDVTADSDFYSLGNKTLVFKAKISNGLNNTAVAGIFSKNKSYTLYYTDAANNRKVNFAYHNNGEKIAMESLIETNTDEWYIYAVVVSYDKASRCAMITVWRSKDANPVSADDFVRVSTRTLNNTDDVFMTGNDTVYLGRRYGDIGKDRGLICSFAGIKLYNTVLSCDQIATVTFDSDYKIIERLYNSVSTLYQTALGISRNPVLSDYEWNTHTAIIESVSALIGGKTLDGLYNAYRGKTKELIELLGKAEIDLGNTIDSVTVVSMASVNTGEMNIVPYNNDILSKIHTGLHSYPIICDYDNDGDYDLIMTSNSISYGKTGGGTYLFRNMSGEKGTLVLGNAEYLFSDQQSYPWVSYMSDGSARYIDYNGICYTGITSSGFTGESRTAPITQQYMLYDVDGDGLEDCVYISAEFEGTAEYDSNGVWLRKRYSSIYWIKNTGTKDSPEFSVLNRSMFMMNTGERLRTEGEYTYIRSIVMSDWDGDGDLDLIAGGWMNEFYYYENVGTGTSPLFSEGVVLRTESGILRFDCCRYNAIGFDWNGDKKTDLIVGSESGDCVYLEFTGKFDPSGSPVFSDIQFFMCEAEGLSVNALSRPTSVDWDGDGDEDLIVGDNSGYLWFIENVTGEPGSTSNDLSDPSWAAPVRLTYANGEGISIKAGPSESLQGAHEAEWGYTIPCAADWDGDGDYDIIVNSVTGRVIWFENIGSKTNPQLAEPKAIEIEWKNGNKYPEWQWWKPDGNEFVTQHRSTVYAIDLNNDGLCDLVALDSEGYLAFYERYSEDGELKLKEGERIFSYLGSALRLSSGTGGQSGRKKFVITDWNGDGLPDIITDSYSFSLYLCTGVSDGIYNYNYGGELGNVNIVGHNHGFTVVDWNGDGIPDIVSGTESGYFYYLKNDRT